MTTLYDSIYTCAFEVPLTPEQLKDVMEWAEEHKEDAYDLVRRTIMEAVFR